MIIDLKNIKFKWLSIICAGLCLLSALFAIIHGGIYHQYFDIFVILFLILGTLAFAADGLLHNNVTSWVNLAGVFFASAGVALYLVNSYNVWADTWGNISQNGVLFGTFNFFGSEGGPVLPFLFLIVGIGACVVGVTSTFKPFEPKEENNA